MSQVLCLVRMTPCEAMLYWPHISVLVDYNGGTGFSGDGPVRTLFFFFFGSTSPQCTLSKSGGPAHYTLVTKPMHSGGPEVDAMRLGLDAKKGRVLHVH